MRFNFDRWSTDWHWVERSHAFDAWRDKEAQKADIAEIQAMRKRHINMAMSLQGTAATALQKILRAEQQPQRDAAGNVIMGADGKPVLGPLTLKPSEVRDLAELGMKIERLNRGEPETISETHHTLSADERREGLRQAAMTPDLRWKLRELLEQHSKIPEPEK